MKNFFGKLSLRKLILLGTALLSVFFVLFYILYCTRGLFNSDMAFWLLLADEQIKNHQLYPTGFHYTTGIPFISTHLLVSFLRLFSSNWILCREIAVIIITVVTFILIYRFYKNTVSNIKPWIPTSITITLLCLPMMQYPQTFYEAAYVWQTIWDLLLTLFIYKIMHLPKLEKSKKVISIFIAYFFFVFINSMSAKNILQIVFPIILTLLLITFVDNDYRFDKLFLSAKHNVVYLISAAGILFGFSAYILISKALGLISVTGGKGFIDYQGLAENFNTFIENIIHYYSAAQASSIFSFIGINSFINILVLLVCAVIAPIWCLVHYWKSENTFWRFYVIYSWMSNILVAYFMIFSSANHYGYYRPIYWHNIVFTTLMITYLIKKKDKYYEWVFYSILALTVLFGNFVYMKNTVLPLRNTYAVEAKEGNLTDYLKANNLTYGFGSFWYSYKYTALSNGDVQIVAYATGSPITPMLWMASDSYYDPAKHPGKCFLLIAPGEQVEEKYYNAASEVKLYKDFKILVYDKHLYEYPELR